MQQAAGRDFIPNLQTGTGVPDEIRLSQGLKRIQDGIQRAVLAPSASFLQKNPPLLILMTSFGMCINVCELTLFYGTVEVRKKILKLA